MKRNIFWVSLALLLSSNANAIDFGVGVKAGTVGSGAEISIGLSQTINARLSLTSISVDYDEILEISDANNSATLDSTMNLDFGASALLFDWYVFDGTFHLTAGFMKNDSTIDFTGTITDATVEFDGTTYNVATDFVDPTMTGRISAGEDYEPYLGIGWGRKAGDEPGLSLSVELGVVLMDPSIDLTAPRLNNTANQALIDADVDAAESAAKEDLSVLEAWPILSVGLNYAF